MQIKHNVRQYINGVSQPPNYYFKMDITQHKDKLKLTYLKEYYDSYNMPLDMLLNVFFRNNPTESITKIMYHHSTGYKRLSDASVEDIKHDINIIKGLNYWNELEHEALISELSKEAELRDCINALPEIEKIKYKAQLRAELEELADSDFWRL